MVDLVHSLHQTNGKHHFLIRKRIPIRKCILAILAGLTTLHRTATSVQIFDIALYPVFVAGKLRK